jgi:hypothetical protein
MNGNELLEENIRKLIKAGLEPQPDPELEKALYRKLQIKMEAFCEPREFPWQAALALSTLLIALAGWILYQALGFHGSTTEPGLFIAGSMILVNLLLLPFAGFLIVIRRRHA